MPASKARSTESRKARSGAGRAPLLDAPAAAPRVTVLLSEAEIVSGLSDALARRELPERYSYWFPISVRAWLGLCSDGAYRNYVRSRGLVVAHAADIAKAARRRAATRLELISLGAGQADKDMAVVRALRARHAVSLYRPVDASQMLLELACAAAAGASVPCEAVKADFCATSQLGGISGMRGGPALWMLLGNTLGAFDPLTLARELRRVVGPRDTLLIDGEIFDADATITGYDNPLNRSFAFAPLAALGLSPDDGELRFALAEDASRPGFFRLLKRFETRRDLRFGVGGEVFDVGGGQALHMGHSGKFTLEGFRAVLEAAGFEGLAEWMSDDGRFVMALVA